MNEPADPKKYEQTPQVVERDITTRIMAEKAMRFHADLLSQVTDAVVVVDNQQTIIYWNKGAESLYQYTAVEVLGRRLEEINPYCWNDAGQGAGACDALNRNGFWRCEGIQHTKNGKKLQVESSVSLLKDESGDVLGKIVITHDITERSLLEKGIRESEKEFRSLFELSAVGKAQADAETGRFIRINKKFCDITGYSENELLGMTFTQITHPEDRNREIDAYQRSLVPTSEGWTSEKRYIRKDGRIIWVKVTGKVIFDGEGNSIRSIADVEDVTERRQAEQAIRESEERYRSLVESSPEAICVQQGGLCVYMNAAGLELLGAGNFEEIEKKEMEHFIHPDFRKAAAEWLLQVGGKGRLTPSLELKILPVKGQEVNAEVAGTPITFAGKPAVQLIIKDISGRKNAELRLRLQATVLSQVNDAVVAIAKDHRIIFWNRGAERLYKMPAEEVIGRRREEVYRYRFITPTYEKAAMESMATNGFLRGENIHILKNGEEICVESSVSVLTDWSNAPVGWLAVMRDSTERKKFEEALRNSERLYRMMFESNPHPMWMYDTNSLRFLFVNDAAVVHYGYSREEFLAMTIKDLRQPEEREVVVDNALKIAAGLHDEGNWRHRKKDGTIIDVEIISHSLNIQGKDARVVLAHDVTKRKEAERALRESEERQRAVFDNSPIAIIVKDLQGRHILFNRQAEKWTNIKREDVIGKTVYDFLPKAAADLCDIKDREVIETRAATQREDILDLPDGKRYHLTVKFPLFDPTGSVYAVCTIVSDISEMKRAEQAIKEARDEAMRDRSKLETILNTIPSGVFVAEGPDGVITHQNEQAFQLLGRNVDNGLTAAERIVKYEMTKSDGTLFKPEEMPYLRALLHGEDVRDAEMTFRRPDGRKITILSNAAPLRDAEGNIIASVTAFGEITERKEAEEALKRARTELELRVRERTAELAATVAALQSEIAERKRTVAERDKLVAAVESTAEAVVVTDNRGIIQYVNPSFEQITGYSRQEAIGRDIHFLDSGQHDKDFFPAMRQTIRMNGVWKGRLINKKKDGTIYYEDCTYSPVKDRSGNIVNYVSIKHDVTERLRLESIAETVDAMNNIGYVFSGIRHEIGNPVSSLLIILSLLKKKYDTTAKETIREYVDQAIGQVERIEYLLKSLKNFNMYENLLIRSVEISSFLEKFIPLVTADLSAKGIAFEVAAAPEHCWMSADPRALQQALLNVIVNASDAVEKRPQAKIVLSTFKAGGMVHIRVSDNGTGISEDRQKQLFKPFYTTKSEGTGLGLVITRKLISRMKGFIEIASRKDEGTIVDIYVPEGTVERTL